MKILFSTTYFTPYISGLTIYVERLGRALIKRGHDVTVLAMQHDTLLPTNENEYGVAITRARSLVRISKGFISIDFVVQAWRLVRESDVIIVNLPQAEGIVMALIGKLMGKRVIALYHCEISLPNTFVNQVIQSLLELSHMATLYLSDLVVAYTQDYADHSKLLRLVREKILVVYPPVEKPQADDAFTQQLKKKIGKAEIVIGISARLAAEKGIEYMLEALPRLTGAKLVIAGPTKPVGEEVYRQKIFSLVERYKRQVLFLGTLSQKEIGSFYQAIDVLVLPSINSTEAFGLVQIEAMLSGAPVVATNLPGVRVPIQETGMGIIVPIKDSRAIASAIKKIVSNKTKYSRPASEIAKIFSMKKTLDIYESRILS